MTDTDTNDLLALALFKSAGDNRVTKDATAILPWSQIVQDLSTHILTDGELDTEADKDRWMFTLALYKDETWGDYEPATQKVFLRDPEGNRILDGQGLPMVKEIITPINPDTGKHYVRRSAANLLGYSALMLDYDGIRNIPWAKERFGRYAHCGYTSYSHMKDGRVNKFRLILPFATPCPVQEFELRKKAFLRFSETDDPSTVAVSRGFYLPQVHPRRAQFAETWSGDGPWLDWTTFKAEKPYVPPPIPAMPLPEGPARLWGRKEFDRVLQRIRDSAEGSRHHNIAGACLRAGSLIAAGVLDEGHARQMLEYEALRKVGPGRRYEVVDLIESGFKKGGRNPAAVPGTYVTTPTPEQQRHMAALKDRLRHQKKWATK